MNLSYEQEIRICKSLLHGAGMPEEDAQVLAESVTHSDFTGIYSHGLSRFSNYLKRFANGAMKANASFTVVNDTGSTMAFDCDNGCGVVAMSKAYDILAERAKEYGIVIGTGMKASNIGCGSFFGQKAVKDGLIGIFCCNTVRCVAPFGGTDKLLGTNPLVVAAPAGEERPLIMDISTTITAMGKIQAAAREGKPIPEGWAIDANGKPTTDPKQVATVLPIAGPKGYGLAVMIEMFSALLAQANYGEGIGWPNKGEPENTGFALILIDVSKFMPLDQFKKSADEYIRNIKNSNKAEGVKEILLPGELEMKREISYRENGYDISEALGSELAAYAVQFGVVDGGASYEDVLNCL